MMVWHRDLVVNNDHIHCVEQRMQLAIEQGLSKRWIMMPCMKRDAKRQNKGPCHYVPNILCESINWKIWTNQNIESTPSIFTHISSVCNQGWTALRRWNASRPMFVTFPLARRLASSWRLIWEEPTSGGTIPVAWSPYTYHCTMRCLCSTMALWYFG